MKVMSADFLIFLLYPGWKTPWRVEHDVLESKQCIGVMTSMSGTLDLLYERSRAQSEWNNSGSMAS